MRNVMAGGLGLALVGADQGQAECLGSCASDMVAALGSMVGYAILALVLLVMLIREKWRRAGLWTLACVSVLSLGVPLVSQGWTTWKLRAVEAREVVGSPPAMAGRTPLLIAPDEFCSASACEAVLRNRGADGIHVVLTSALYGLDLSQPVPLSDLPLEFWTGSATSNEVVRRVLTPDERRQAAGLIDYLVVTNWAYFPGDAGPVEQGLRRNPRLAGMGKGEVVRLLLAPLVPREGVLDLATLAPDILDLTLLDRALAIPLAPRNTQGAGNEPVGVEVTAAAICLAHDASGNCASLLER